MGLDFSFWKVVVWLVFCLFSFCFCFTDNAMSLLTVLLRFSLSFGLSCHKALPEDLEDVLISLSPTQHPLRCLVQPRVQGPWFFCAGMWRNSDYHRSWHRADVTEDPSLIANGKEETSCHSLSAKSR